MSTTVKIYSPTRSVHLVVERFLRVILWLELPWILLLAFPLTLPGRFMPVHHTPTLILLLFVFWPIRGWLALRDKGIRYPRWLIPVVGLLIALVISLIVANDLRFAWLMTAHLALGICLFVALILWPPTQRQPLLVALGVIGFALFLSVIGPPLIGETLPSARASTLFVMLIPMVKSWQEPLNPNILAGGILLGIPLSLALALAPWRNDWKSRILDLFRTVFWLFTAVWLCQVLTLTDSRGALFAAICSLVIVVVLRWPMLIWLALNVAFIGSIWLLMNDPLQKLNFIMATGMASDYNSRMEIWVRSWLAFRSHWLTGIGIGGFVPLVVEGMLPIRVPLSPQVTHAHNLILQVAIDLGILGVISYLACMGISVVYAVRAWRENVGKRTLATGTLAALVALNLHGLVDAPLWNSKLAFLPWLLFALAILLAQPSRLQSAQGALERGQKEGLPIDKGVA